MNTLSKLGCVIGFFALASGGQALAQTSPQTNTMTNIAVVQAGCDIAAIGIDFGFVASSTGAAQLPTTNPNTAAGNMVSGTTHSTGSAKGADGGGDDSVTFSGALGTLLNASIGTVINAASDLIAGVYVACSVTPSSITVTNAASSDTAVLYAGGVLTVNETLDGTLASATDTMLYSVGFTGTALDLGIVGTFAAQYIAAGTIGANQEVDPGDYTEVWTASVEF